MATTLSNFVTWQQGLGFRARADNPDGSDNDSDSDDDNDDTDDHGRDNLVWEFPRLALVRLVTMDVY